MSSTTQKVRQKTCSVQNDYFPQSFVTQQDSCILMKKVLTSCVSNITYIRNLLPEDCYKEKKIGNCELRIISGKARNNLANQIIKSIEGAFDALDKKYLKDFIFVLFTDLNDPDNSVQELYKFNFKYEDENNLATFHIKTKDKEGTESTLLKIEDMVTELNVAMGDMEELPDKVHIQTILTYYPSCPDDYEPKGYKAHAIQDYMIKSMPFGAVGPTTKFHGFSSSWCPTARNSDGSVGLLANDLDEADDADLDTQFKMIKMAPVPKPSSEDVRAATKDVEASEVVNNASMNATSGGDIAAAQAIFGIDEATAKATFGTDVAATKATSVKHGAASKSTHGIDVASAIFDDITDSSRVDDMEDEDAMETDQGRDLHTDDVEPQVGNIRAVPIKELVGLPGVNKGAHMGVQGAPQGVKGVKRIVSKANKSKDPKMTSRNVSRHGDYDQSVSGLKETVQSPIVNATAKKKKFFRVGPSPGALRKTCFESLEKAKKRSATEPLTTKRSKLSKRK